MANRNFPNSRIYTGHVMPVLLDCNFVVSSTDTGGLGITSLKGPGIQSVYMNTSATPATGNPNPAAGVIAVKLSDNYNRLYAIQASIHGPNGAATTSSKANVTNIITVLGTATLAQWQTVGLPTGVTPAVGVAFIGNQAAVIGGSAQTAIALAAGAGIDHIESVGNPNLTTLNPSGSTSTGMNGQGGMLYLRCYKNTVLTAPTDGSIIRLMIYLSNSSVLIQGE